MKGVRGGYGVRGRGERLWWGREGVRWGRA